MLPSLIPFFYEESTGLKNEDASMSLAGVVERNFNRNRFQTWVQGSRDGQTRIFSAAEQENVVLYVDSL